MLAILEKFLLVSFILFNEIIRLNTGNFKEVQVHG